jgi:hypothetical protein
MGVPINICGYENHYELNSSFQTTFKLWATKPRFLLLVVCWAGYVGLANFNWNHLEGQSEGCLSMCILAKL